MIAQDWESAQDTRSSLVIKLYCDLRRILSYLWDLVFPHKIREHDKDPLALTLDEYGQINVCTALKYGVVGEAKNIKWVIWENKRKESQGGMLHALLCVQLSGKKLRILCTPVMHLSSVTSEMHFVCTWHLWKWQRLTELWPLGSQTRRH